MELKQFAPSEQVDPAVNLKAIPPPLPDICFFEDFAANPPLPPPQVIEGILHRGCKMLLGGTSKSNKSWCLLDLALSVASGQPWWGRPCAKMAVAYINFELQPWALAQRLNALCAARPECKIGRQTLALWNLRGRNADLTLLRPMLEEHLATYQFGLIILDMVKRYDFDRLPRESVKAFTAFQVNLDLGPERSLATVAAKLGKSKVMMEKWSRKYDWPGRVAAHVGYVAEIERQAIESLAREKAIEWHIRVRGDGRRYKFTARTDRSFDSAIYQSVFPTKQGEWKEHRLPMKNFVPTFRGRVLSSEPPLDPARVTSVGGVTADQQDGPFQLDVAWIKVALPASQ